MRIITSSRHKDFYDRFSDPTDSLTTWVRTPELVNHPALSLNSDRQPIELEPQVNGFILGARDLKKDEQLKKQGDEGPFHLEYRDRWNYNRLKTPSHGYEVVEVVFCGKFYRGLVYYENQPIGDQNDIYPTVETLYRVYWSVEQVAQDHLEKKDKHPRGLLSLRGGKSTPLANWFQPVVHNDIVEACIQLESPVFIRAKRQRQSLNDVRRTQEFRWMKNATWLDTLQFIKVMDPHTAFQELSMFVGGVMTKPEPIHKVPDALKVLAHGMDERSFRKDPSKVHY